MIDFDSFTVRLSRIEGKRRKEFGDLVKNTRRELNLNMNDLATRANISGELLLRIEAGLVSPDIPRIPERLLRAMEREVMVIA
ncbi:hypothetical protein [Rossellomorea marisflavi]|uniref:hypothetical protein n=1 Tax=Rossellomorea marisflavi TaxID=189381 RepID=UPI003D2EA5E7